MSARRFWYSLGAITLAGYALRLFYIWNWRRHEIAGVVAGFNDAGWYHGASKLLADGRGFISPFFSAPGVGYQAADHPPVYVVFLAGFSKLGLDSPTQQLVLTSTFIGAPTIWFAGLAGRAMQSSGVGVVTALLVALSPNVFGWEGMLLSEPTAILFVTTTVWAAYRYWRSPSTGNAAILGLTTALAAMSRAELILLFGFVVAPLLWRHGARDARALFARFGAVALVAVAVIGPWVGYNLSRFEHPVYLSSGGEITLASATCDQTYYGTFVGFWSHECVVGIRADIARRFPPRIVQADGRRYEVPQLDQSEEARIFRESAVDYIREHTRRFPAVIAARWGRITYTFRPDNVVLADAYFEGREPWVARSGRWTFYGMATFGVIGAVAMRRARIPRFPLAGVLATVLITVTIAFGNPRYRSSAETALCLFAAMGLVATARRLRARMPEAAASDTNDTPVTSTARVDTSAFPCFDGLRAIAALLVAVTHSGFISGFNVRSSGLGAYVARMDIGVAIFFVISGFLLYRPFVAARITNRSGPAVRPYVRRRFLRITPAYWVTLSAVFLFAAIQGHQYVRPGWDQWDTYTAHYGLLHTYHPRFGLLPVQQAWTLVTEIAFYALLPVYAALMARRRRAEVPARLRDEFVGVAILFALGIAARTVVLYGIDDGAWRGLANLWLPARLDHFALGMLLAVLSVQHREAGIDARWARHPDLARLSWGASVLTFWFLAVGLGLNDFRGPIRFSVTQEWWLLFLWGVVGVTAVAPAVFGAQDLGWIRRFLQFRLMTWLGLLSYGIYLWHEAAIDWYLRNIDGTTFRLPALELTAFMLAVSIPVAAASYYAVERPALRLKSRPLNTWFARRGTSGVAR